MEFVIYEILLMADEAITSSMNIINYHVGKKTTQTTALSIALPQLKFIVIKNFIVITRE